MLETLLQIPFFLNRHREAPLLEEREMFLRYLRQQGTSRAALLSLSNELLHVARLLRLGRMRDVSLEEIRRAADCFVREEQSNPRARSYRHTGTFFIYAAKKWLRFHGRLRMPGPPPVPFAEQLDQFARHMLDEQGLSPYSVGSHCSKTSMFLRWIRERRRSLATVAVEDVDDFLGSLGKNGWNRKSVSVAGTGMRVSEALRLRLMDVDLRRGVVTIRGTKFYKSRLVPLGPDVQGVIERYLRLPGRWNQHYQPLFQTKSCKSISLQVVDKSFFRLRQLAGITRDPQSTYQPRVHDLRQHADFPIMPTLAGSSAVLSVWRHFLDFADKLNSA